MTRILNCEMTDDEFRDFAISAYRNVICMTPEEFDRDIATIRMIKKSLSLSYKMNVRLLVNQVITFFNVFERDKAVQMLWMSVNEKYHPELKTVLFYLCYILVNDILFKDVKMNNEFYIKLETM